MRSMRQSHYTKSWWVHSSRRECRKLACERYVVADDLFTRMVVVNLNQWYTEEDYANVAGAINKVLSSFGTKEADGVPWSRC